MADKRKVIIARNAQRRKMRKRIEQGGDFVFLNPLPTENSRGCAVRWEEVIAFAESYDLGEQQYVVTLTCVRNGGYYHLKSYEPLSRFITRVNATIHGITDDDEYDDSEDEDNGDDNGDGGVVVNFVHRERKDRGDDGMTDHPRRRDPILDE